MAAMLDRVAATIKLEKPNAKKWRTQLHALLGLLHKADVAHPGLASMTLTDSPTGDAILGMTENLFGILLAGGIDAQDAAWACDILVLLVTAASREDDVRRPPGRRGAAATRDQAEQVYQTFASLPPEQFSLISAHAAQMVAGDSEKRFRFAVDLATSRGCAQSWRADM